MSSKILFTVLFVSCVSACLASTCLNPSISSSSFTTQDANVVTHIAYISQFKLTCGGKPADIPLYAEVSGKSLTVFKSKESGDYVVSWLEEPKKAPRGNLDIKIYDDEGYAAVRKAQRTGEDSSSVEPLVTVVLNHPGAYNGPWINSELAALVVATGVLYYAIISKTKLMA